MFRYNYFDDKSQRGKNIRWIEFECVFHAAKVFMLKENPDTILAESTTILPTKWTLYLLENIISERMGQYQL